MALTFPTTYQDALGRPIQENWLVQLFYNDPVTNPNDFIGLAYWDTTVGGVKYYGIIDNEPQIRTEIDLRKCRVRTSNMALTLINFSYNSSPFSEELFGGTNDYINGVVKVFSQLSDEATLSNCLQIFEGRLTINGHDEETISLMVLSKRPWDKISVPNVSTSVRHIPIPIAYGAFTKNTEGWNFHTGKTLRPCPFVYTRKGNAYYLTGDIDLDGTSGKEPDPHFHDNSLDQFIPIKDAATASINLYLGHMTWFPEACTRRLKYRPDETEDDNAWSTPANAYDTDTNSKATKTITLVTASGSADLKISIPEIDGVFSYLHLLTSWTLSITAEGNPLYDSLKLKYRSTVIKSMSGVDFDFNTAEDYDILSAYETDKHLPDPIVYTLEWTVGVGPLSGYGWIHDCIFKGTYDIDWTDTKRAIRELAGIKYCYIGADGYAKSYNGGSGTVTEIHEAHRDMLKRFSGWDQASIDGWTDLDTDRSGWNIRWWILESSPNNLKSILERMQYEGCFIFLYRPDGSGRYIHIEDSYSPGDEVHTLSKDDLRNTRIGLMPVAGLITKRTIKYERHPAQRSTYLSEVIAINSTSRTDYHIGADENHKEEKLDMLVANVGDSNPENDDPNDSFAGYHNHVSGYIKPFVTGNIINPEMYNLEPGDAVLYDNSNMITNPWGFSWTSRYFMVTEIVRSRGELSYKAEEVYSA